MSSKILTITIIVFFFFVTTGCSAEVLHTKIRSKGQEALYIDTFGFTETGRVELNISRISLSIPSHNSGPTAAFFLIPVRNDSIYFEDYYQPSCHLLSGSITVLYNFVGGKNQSESGSDSVELSISKPDAYSLYFQNCLPVHASMHVRSAMYNHNGKQKNYLSSRKQNLFGIYLLFSSIYLLSVVFWKYQDELEFSYIFILFAAYKLILYSMELMHLLYISYIGDSQSLISVSFTWFTSLLGDFVPLHLLLGFICCGWLLLPKDNLLFPGPYSLLFAAPAMFRFAFNILIVAGTAMFPSMFPQSRNTLSDYFRLGECVSYVFLALYLYCATKHLVEVGEFDGKAALILRKVKMYYKLFGALPFYGILSIIPVFLDDLLAHPVVTGYPWIVVLIVESRMLLVYISVVCIFWPLVGNQISLSIDDEEEKWAAEVLKEWKKDDEPFDLIEKQRKKRKSATADITRASPVEHIILSMP